MSRESSRRSRDEMEEHSPDSQETEIMEYEEEKKKQPRSPKVTKTTKLDFFQKNCHENSMNYALAEPYNYQEDDIAIIFSPSQGAPTAVQGFCYIRDELLRYYCDSDVTLWNNKSVRLAKVAFPAFWVANLLRVLNPLPGLQSKAYYIYEEKDELIGSRFGVSQLHEAKETVRYIKPFSLEELTRHGMAYDFLISENHVLSCIISFLIRYNIVNR